MKKFAIVFIGIVCVFQSCISIKNTIQNIDNNAPSLVLLSNNTFELKGYSNDKRYGYNPDYPINIYYGSALDENINQPRFLNALAGPNGEVLNYRKLQSCCPFPSKNAASGAGLLDVYELSWLGLKKPLKIYINIYEKGFVMVPKGLSLRKSVAVNE